MNYQDRGVANIFQLNSFRKYQSGIKAHFPLKSSNPKSRPFKFPFEKLPTRILHQYPLRNTDLRLREWVIIHLTGIKNPLFYRKGGIHTISHLNA